jgi:XTP/dITP diphosphohydrolase
LKSLWNSNVILRYVEPALMKLLFATTNPHKFEELRTLLGALPLDLVSLNDLGFAIPEPDESGGTLEQNARIKAVAYARASGMACLADDSGLEVESLGGAPGVRSARYAGFEGPRAERDEKNRQHLLSELRKVGAAPRTARLVCTLCLAHADGAIAFEARGTCEAEIIDELRGEHGFGYDVLLYLRRFGKTAAELPPEEWNRISHRAEAAAQLAKWLEGRGALA